MSLWLNDDKLGNIVKCFSERILKFVVVMGGKFIGKIICGLLILKLK